MTETKQRLCLSRQHCHLHPDYPAISGEVANTGTTIQVHTSGNLMICTTPYKLLQYHFHASSEAAINGVHYNANVHLVHQTPKVNWR